MRGWHVGFGNITRSLCMSGCQSESNILCSYRHPKFHRGILESKSVILFQLMTSF